MKRQASRIFAFVLAVMMLVSSVPTTAFACEVQAPIEGTTESVEETVASSVESTEEKLKDASSEEQSESSEKEETSSEMIEEVSEEISFEETTFEEVTTEEETSICETEVVTETETEVMSTETDNRSDEGTPTECVITFEKFGDVTIYDAEGVNEISSITVTYGSTETVSFLPVAGDGYTVQSAIASGSFKFVRNDQGVYVGNPPKKTGITESITVTVTVTEIAEYTVDFLNAEDVDGLQIMADGEVITLTDGRVTASNDDRITFKLKAKEGTIVRTAYKLVGDEEDISEMEVYETDEEGYSYYVLGKVFENYIVTIYVEEVCNINFETDKVTIQEVRLYDDESWYDTIGDVYDAVTVEKGKDFYFKVEKMYSYGSFFVSTDGTEKGKIDSYWNNDGITIYKITPDGDMSITASLEPVSAEIITGDLEDLSVTVSDDVTEIAQDKSTVYFYQPVSTEISFMPLADKFYSAYYTYSEYAEKTDENGNCIYDEEGNFILEWVDRDEPIPLSKDEETGKYSFSVSLEDNIKSITIESEQAYQLNFTTSNACINRVAYDDAVGDWWVEEDGISSTKVTEGINYYFAVKQEKGSADYLTWSVSTDGTESGELKPYANWYDGRIYKVTMNSDMDITAKVIPKSVPVTYPEGLQISATSSDDNAVAFSEDVTSVNVYDNAEVTFSFEAEEGKTYNAYYTYAGKVPVLDEDGSEVYDEMGGTVYKTVEYTHEIEIQAGEENQYSFTIPMETSVKDISISAGEAWPVHFDVESPFGGIDVTAYNAAMYQDENGYFKGNIIGETENVLKGESLYFCVERDKSSYVIPVVTVDGTEVQPYWTKDNRYVYKVTPEAEMNVFVSATQRTVAVNAPELTDFTITALSEGLNAVIAEDLKSVGMTGACEFSFKFKPVEGKQYSAYKNYTIKTPDYDVYGNKQVDESGNVIYTSKSYEQKIGMELDDAGYYTFRLELDSNTTSVSIMEAEACMLSFVLDDKVSVYEVLLGDQESGIIGEEEITDSLAVGIGEPVYFEVDAIGFLPEYISYEVSTPEGVLKQYMNADGRRVYKVIPSADTVINVTVLPKTIELVGISELTDFSMSSSSEWTVVSEDKKSMGIFEGNIVTLRFKPLDDKLYDSYYTVHEEDYRYDAESGEDTYVKYEVENTIDWTIDEEGYYTTTIDLNLHTKSITIKQLNTNIVTFDTTSSIVTRVSKNMEDNGDGDIYTYYQSYGEPIEGAVRVAVGKTLYFSVSVESAGNLSTAFVSTDGTETGRLEKIAIDDMGYAVYAVTPTENMTLTVKALPKTIPIEGGADLTDFTVTSEDPSYEVVLSEDKLSVDTWAETSALFRFKPAADKFYNVYCTITLEEDLDEDGIYQWVDRKESIELVVDEEGYYICSMFLSNSTKSITIETIDTNLISFDTIKAKVYEVDKWVEDWGDDEPYIRYERGTEIEGTKRVASGKTFYFAVTVEEAGLLASSFVSTDGTETGRLKSVGTDDSYSNRVYEVTPTDDMTLTVKALPKSVELKYETEPEELTFSRDDGYDLVWNKDAGLLETYEEGTFQLRFKPDQDTAYWVSYTYSEYVEKTDENGEIVIDPETGDYVYELVDFTAQVELADDADGYYNYQMYFYGNLKSINIESAQLYDVKFESRYGYAHAYSDTGEELSTLSLPEGKVFTFQVWMDVDEEVAYLDYVTTTGDESGRIEPKWDEDSENYCYTIVPQGDMTVTMADKPSVTAISFDNQSSSMNYTVKTNDNVWFIDDDGSYRANKEAGTFDFTVTVSKGNMDPAVTYVDENDKIVSVAYGKKAKAEDGSRTFEYSVKLNKMPHPAVLTIDETEEQYDIAVTYDNKHMASVVAETENDVVTPVALLSSDGQLLFRVQRGDDLIVNMTAKDKCRITEVMTTQAGIVTNATVQAASYELVVSAVADAVVEVKTQMHPEFVMKQIRSDGTKVNVDNLMTSEMVRPYGKFNLAEGVFEGSLLDEKGNTIVLSEIEVLEKYADYVKLSADKTKVEIDTKSFMSKETNPKRQGVKVVLTDKDGNESIMNLQLYPDVDKITSKFGIFGNNSDIDITVDSRQYYSFDATPLSADTDMIGVELATRDGLPEDILSVTLTGHRLCIEASAAEPAENAAVLKLYRKNYLPTDAEYYIEGTTVAISTVKPTALENGKPDVAFESSDDRNITVSVKPPVNIMTSRSGMQYYKVVVTPQAEEGKEIPASILSATANPFYIERELTDFSDIEDEEAAEAAYQTYRQNITLGVNDCAYGLGQGWKYDIAVSLIQTKDKTPVNAENEAECVAYRSKETIVTGVETKQPVFETKLSIKKKGTKIYTTQENVLAGILGFSKATTNKDVLVKDITSCKDSEKLQVVVDGDNIYASATSETKLGKHTIEVAPMGPDGMYQTGKTFVITVEKGIENLALQVPAYRLYKQTNKAATMTVKAVFNPDDTAAKTKKVTWEVLNEAGESFTENDELYNKLTIKNGKVSVKKDLNLSGDIRFRVKASAADFAGNKTCVVSDEIIISATARELERVVLVKKNAKTYYYDIVAKDGSKITSDQLTGAEVVAFAKGTPVKESYTATELNAYALTANEAVYKSSNKALTLNSEDGKVKVKPVKTAKNIKITVTTTDGGKKSVSMKMDILHLTPAELGVEMYLGDALLTKTDSKSATFDGTINKRIKVVLKQKAEQTSDWSEVTGFTNHSIGVKNAKILSSDIEKGVYEIVVTNQKATITLQDKTNKEKKVYELTNNTYSVEKAPKITVKSSLKISETRKQTIAFTLPENYDTQNKYVIVELNAVEKAKKRAVYSILEKACRQWSEPIEIQDKKFELSFKGENIPKGSYKLNVTIGTKAEGGTFIAVAKPVNVTIKAAAPKVTKGFFKLKTSYTLEASAGASVSLAYTHKILKEHEYTELLNVNIKGVPNEFTKYFEFSEDKCSLKLKDTLSKEDIVFLTSKDGKNHLNGYVTYTASYGDDGYGNPYVETKTVKITVKLKK